MIWDPLIPRWLIAFYKVAWTIFGVWGYIETRVTKITLDTRACEAIKTAWAGCVTYQDGIVHVKWFLTWWAMPGWIYAMVHEAAHIDQYRTGWNMLSPSTEWNAHWRALMAILMRRH